MFLMSFLNFQLKPFFNTSTSRRITKPAKTIKFICKLIRTILCQQKKLSINCYVKYFTKQFKYKMHPFQRFQTLKKNEKLTKNRVKSHYEKVNTCLKQKTF